MTKSEHVHFWMLASDPRFLTNRYIEMIFLGERLYEHELETYDGVTRESDRLFVIVQHYLTDVKLCDDVEMKTIIENTRWGTYVYDYLMKFITHAKQLYEYVPLRQLLIHHYNTSIKTTI